jgi:hypothetical protein
MSKTAVGVRAIAAVGVLAGVLAGGWGRTPDVRAAVASRGDPKIWIAGTSGGVSISCKITIDVAVSTTSGSIQSITYAIHGPIGTAVTQEVATGGALKGMESYTYTADQTDRQVMTVTTVTTTGGSVPVTVAESAVQQSLGSTASLTVSGMSNLPITTLVSAGSAKAPAVNWGS